MTWLAENYFSKTKDQKITSVLEFDNLTFENEITAPHMTLEGDVNGVNLEEFIRTALLDDYDQIFEIIAYLEYITIDSKALIFISTFLLFYLTRLC